MHKARLYLDLLSRVVWVKDALEKRAWMLESEVT